jgi:Fe-S oxidoreductase
MVTSIADANNIFLQCYQCGVCSSSCPKARVLPGFLPRRMVFQMINGFEDRQLDSGLGWECLTCGKCQVNCPQGIDIVGLVRDMRSEMKGRGVEGVVAHDSILSPMYSIMLNPNIKPKKGMYLSEDVKTDPGSKTLFFVGCAPHLDAPFRGDVGFTGIDGINDAIKALNLVGITPAVLDDEKCCAHDYLWRGERGVFEAFGRQNAKALEKFDNIITACPECYRTLAVEYKDMLGVELNVKHLSEVIRENLDKIKSKERGEITYHDSCRLGRFMNVYDEPREVLSASGYRIHEMTDNKENALCCGVPTWVNCNDENKKIREKKLDDALATGAKKLVVPCPKCEIHLKCLQVDKSEEGKYPLEIVNLSTVIRESLEDK